MTVVNFQDVYGSILDDNVRNSKLNHFREGRKGNIVLLPVSTPLFYRSPCDQVTGTPGMSHRLPQEPHNTDRNLKD